MISFIKEKVTCWEKLAAETRPIFIYGMGDGALKIMAVFREKGITLSGIFASDDFVRGHYFEGYKVHKLSEIEEMVDDFVVVLAFAAGYQEIVDKIQSIAERHTLYVPDVPVAGGGLFTYDYCKENAEKIAMFSAPILEVLIVLLTPFNWIFGVWQKLLSLIFKPSGESGITEQELLTIVDEAEQGGEIDADEVELIRSAIEFNELEVRDIFTPRIDIEAIPVDMEKEEVARIFSESGYSRLPVYEGSIDNITGIIYLKDFYNTAFRTKTSIEEIVKPVSFVPKSKKIADLRKELQEQQLHIAIVMDEFGCTVGLVTLEDILEELVGEIWDEHDEIVREIMQTDEHTWVVSGKANVEKVFEVLDQECAYEAMTVAGWVMEILEKIPAEGDHFEQDGLQVRVTKMYRKRIEQVEIIKAPVDASQEQEDAE